VAVKRFAPRADVTSEMSQPVEETTASVAVARQPIFDRSESIAGFEILYRSLTGPFTDAEGATSAVIVQSLADIGLERLVGAARAYINVTREFLLKVRPLPMPPDRVVLELVGTHSADPELLGAPATPATPASGSRSTASATTPRSSRCSSSPRWSSSTSSRCRARRWSSRCGSCASAG
jgi:hypothetical protein